MTDSRFRHRPEGGSLPEIPAEGLVLWRLHSYDDEWWCTVENFAEHLVLRVHTPDESRTALTEALDTAAEVVTRADELCAQYLTQGWRLRDAGGALGAPGSQQAIVSVWFSEPAWHVTGVQCHATAAIRAEDIMTKPPLGRVFAPDLVSAVREALLVASTGEHQVMYFKAIRKGRVDWRRGVMFREDARVRMDIFEATEAETMAHAVEVDLRL